MGMPDIIFLFSDQQRWDTCGCYGQSLATTLKRRMAEAGEKVPEIRPAPPVPEVPLFQEGRS